METPERVIRPVDRDLEPTIAVPIVDARPVHEPAVVVSPPSVTLADRPPAPARLAYVYGNPLAYLARRGFALALDIIVPTMAVVGILYERISINPLTGLPLNNQGAFDITVEVAVAIALLYIVLSQAVFGTTLGKLLVGLHLYARSARFIGFGRALLRNILLPVDLIVIGLLLVVLPGHRRLGDLVGGTVVARSPLRAFAPLLGLCGLLVVAALPFALAGGPVHALATLAAFLTLGPHIVERIVTVGLQIVEAVRGMLGSR